MRRSGVLVVSVLVVLAIVIGVLLLLPAPDPLRDATTVYIDTGAADDSSASVEFQDGLRFVLNDRDLVLVSAREQADAEIRIQAVSLNLGDVTLTLGNEGITGRLIAVCEVTDLRTARTHTMDLTITLDGGDLAAELRGRKFCEFWK